MSAVLNPYAPPQSKLSDTAHDNQSMWRDGAQLVLLQGSAFPDRCIKCNDPVAPPVRRYKLYWHSAWLYLLILVNILIYLIVALAIRKRAEVEVGLCERHQRRVLTGRIIGWGGFAALLAATGLAIAFHWDWLLGLSALLVLPWALATLLTLRMVYPTRIDKELVRLKGCGEEFLASLANYKD
jgi:hypothetical protein